MYAHVKNEVSSNSALMITCTPYNANARHLHMPGLLVIILAYL